MSRPEVGSRVRGKRPRQYITANGGPETIEGTLTRYQESLFAGTVAVIDSAGFGCGYFVEVDSLELLDSESSVRERVIDEAKKLITGDRNRSYGSPTQNFRNTADLWTVQFRHKLKDGESFSSSDVASAMIHLKQARRIAGDKEDNWTDTIGYAACGAECDAEDSDD